MTPLLLGCAKNPITESLVTTGVVKVSSTKKLYQELGLESLPNRQWFRKLYVFYKIAKEQSPKCKI